MFNLEKATLTQHRKEVPIVRWAVWFQTPFGLATTYEEAVSGCRERDLLPDLVIAPVPVAIDSQDRYEIIMRAQ